MPMQNFLLKRFKVIDKGVTIIDISFSSSNAEMNSSLYTSLILGKNGSGKSFLFKQLIKAFRCLINLKSGHSRIHYRFESFILEYYLNGDTYRFERTAGQGIEVFRSGSPVEKNDFDLPDRIIAAAFTVNDKYIFGENNPYIYLGVRSAANNTYTSSITKKIAENLIDCLADNNRFSMIERVLSELDFDLGVTIVTTEDDKNPKYHKINSSEEARAWHFEYVFLNKLNVTNMILYRSGNEIELDDCSSGERHVLFSLIGIIKEINTNSLILIDEPELSLHPEWQIRYISWLSKVFENYPSCHFLLASHSHYLVSSLRPEASSLIKMSCNGNGSYSGNMVDYSTYAWSAESVIYEIFETRTSRNYYFLNDLMKLQKLLNCHDVSVSKFNEINSLIKKLEKYEFHEADPLRELIQRAKVSQREID